MNPFESLWESRPGATATAPVKAAPKPKKVADHSAARAIYQRYVAKCAELAPFQEYARRVVAATAGTGKTPVTPLATMGAGGGPLVCDHCGKPMILEGGAFNGVFADAAWKRNPDRGPGWVSYISRGMVVEIATNRTVRIYHGYIGKSGECCTVAKAADDAAEAAFTGQAPAGILNALAAFLRDEFPDATDRERCDIINGVVLTLYSHDPGRGANRPE